MIELIQEKMHAEQARAEALDTLSKFDLNHLKDSPFEEAALGII